MAETNGTAAVQDSSPSVAEFVGEMMGDFMAAEPDTATGAPPATHPESPPSEGTAPSGQAGEPPASADATTQPVLDPNAPAPESDPLDGATPLSYTVNGEARQFEGITRLKSGEGIVEADAMALLERRLGERDHLFESNRAQYEQIETLNKLTEWRIRGENGQEQVLTGRQGVEAQRLALGNAYSELKVLREILGDPQKLAQLLYVDQDDQGNVRSITLNADAVGMYRTRVENEQLKAAQQVRSAMARYGATAQPTQQSQTFDPASVAPAALDTAMKAANATGLTDADKTFLQGQAVRYIRQATQADVRTNPTLRVGMPIIDPEFVDVVKDRAQLRASTTAQVTSATEASRRNAANIAAASAGKKTPPRAPAPPAPAQPPQQREADEDAAFDARLKTSAALLRQPA